MPAANAGRGQHASFGRRFADIARGFYEAFLDTVVFMDLARLAGDLAVYLSTCKGTNTGPGGTGHVVRFNGWEQWTLDDDGLIAVSEGQFDTAEYERPVDPRSLTEPADPTSRADLSNDGDEQHAITLAARVGAIRTLPAECCVALARY